MAPLPKLTDPPYHDHDNDNERRIATNAPGSSFKRYLPGQFETADYLIKGILPLHGVVLLAGQYSSGKTFVAIDIGLTLNHGVEYLGRKTKPGAVLWIAAEGAGILEQRLEAARLAKFKASIDAPYFPFLWEDAAPKGDTNVILADLGDKIREAKNECDKHHPDLPLRLVVIDTLAAFFALKDENDNAEVGTFMARLGKLARDMNVLIMPIHHMGKSAEGGIRGASAFGAGADGALAVLAKIDPQTGEVDGARSISLAKTRSGDPGPLAAFSIAGELIGRDRDDDSITRGYVMYTPLGASKGKLPARGVQVLLNAITEAMLNHGTKVQTHQDSPPRQAVRVDFVRDEFKRGYISGDSSNTDSVRKAYDRALKTVLEGNGFASRRVGDVEYIWPIQV